MQKSGHTKQNQQQQDRKHGIKRQKQKIKETSQKQGAEANNNKPPVESEVNNSQWTGENHFVCR